MNEAAALAIMPVELNRRIKRAGLICFDQDPRRSVGQHYDRHLAI